MSEKTEKTVESVSPAKKVTSKVKYILSFPNESGDGEAEVEILSSLNCAKLAVILASNPMSKVMQKDHVELRVSLETMFSAKSAIYPAESLFVTLDNPKRGSASYKVSLATMRKILDLVTGFQVISFRERDGAGRTPAKLEVL